MNEQSFEYRTGQTQPQKSNRGLVAFLLICIIFLCGLVSVMGMMNIHLLEKLQQAGTETPLSFSEQKEPVEIPPDPVLTVAGMHIQEIPEIYRSVYELPAGLFITHVIEASPGEALGILPGDVLVSFDGTAVTSLEELKALHAKKKPGEQVPFTVHRQNENFTHTITIED